MESVGENNQTKALNKSKQNHHGGKFINSGSYGCVFKPHLKCKDVNNIPNSVGKVFDRLKDFEEEYKIATRIRKDIDPEGEFTVPMLASCNVQYMRKTDQFSKCDLAKPSMKPSDYKQIIYPNAGKDIDSILENETPMRGSATTFLKLLVAFRPILDGLTRLTDKQLIHNDIKSNNIMYKKGRLFLIDFGELIHHEELFTRMMVPNFVDDIYWYPPECKAFIHPRSEGSDALYRKVMNNFKGFRFIVRALVTHLRMNPMADLQSFYNAQVPQKQYKDVCAPKVDVYAIGLVILQLYLWSEFHEQIYKTNSPKAVIREMVLNLIRGMVNFDPRRRSSSTEALAQLDDIIKLMDCLKRPSKDVKKSPSAQGQRPATKLNICVGKLAN